MTRTLIVGATSTVASDVARLLAADAGELLLLARDEQRLAELAFELGDSVVEKKSCDFLELSATRDALIELLGHGPVDQVLIAQGYLGDQSESERDFREAQRQIAVNYTSVVSQLLVIGEYLEGRGTGHLIVLSSVAGDRGRPRNYTYGSAKGALGLYLQGLRSRLFGRVRVTTVKLGPVITKMSAGHPRNATFITSQAAARGIHRAMNGRGGELYVPGFYRWIMLLVRTLPETLFQRVSFLSGR